MAPITVRRFISSGQLRAIKVGRGIRVDREAIDRFLTPGGQGPEGSFAENGAADPAREANSPQERIGSAPLTPEQLARRQAIVDAILETRKKLVIFPMTTTELVHAVRNEEETSGRPGG